jgi:hypothetical protein
MNYIVDRIVREDIYTDLSDKAKQECIDFAQKLRDDKLNTGTARTVDQRLNQGNVKKELFDMCDRVRCII